MSYAFMPNRARRSFPSQLGRHRAGFTVVELIAIVFIILVLIAILLSALSSPCGGRLNHRQLKDSTQVRGIMQAMVVFAQSNQEKYPLPSELDLAHHTIADPGEGREREKDTTRNIVSILINGGFISPEICVSPNEVNNDIEAYEGYQYDAPVAAVSEDKSLALWDPAFRALPTDGPLADQKAGDAGGFSYAHALPFGQRQARWAMTFSSTEASFANRGPAYQAQRTSERGGFALIGADAQPGETYDTPAGLASNTLLIHGTRDKWEGNIGFNDNHVEFSNQPDPKSIPLPMPGDATRSMSDNIFVNENDETLEGEPYFDGFLNADRDNANAYLRSYSRVDASGDALKLDFFWD